MACLCVWHVPMRQLIWAAGRGYSNLARTLALHYLVILLTAHCPGNKSSESHMHTSKFTRTHAQGPLRAVFFLISLRDWWGQMGEQWESGRPSLVQRRHACTDRQTSLTHTGSETNADWIGKWQTRTDNKAKMLTEGSYISRTHKDTVSYQAHTAHANLFT